MVSLYIDQVGPLDSATGNFAALDDLGVGFAEKYGARLCGSIAEALWCARLLLHFTPPHHTVIRPYRLTRAGGWPSQPGRVGGRGGRRPRHRRAR